MKIRNLSLINYRNYEKLNIELSSGVNVFQGANAQGKTNILEAIYYCGFGKSHRTNKVKDIIMWDKEYSIIKLYIEMERIDRQIEISLLSDGKKGMTINKIRLLKIGDLLGVLNIVMFSPEDLRIVKESPGVRRRFLDMEISQIDKRYYNSLVDYNKVLSQRNITLKKKNPDEDIISVYDEQLSEFGEYIIQQRLNYIELINFYGKEIHKKITMGKESVEFIYKSTCDYKAPIKESILNDLRKSRKRDIGTGYTSVGPHRDDFLININDADAKDFGSQGQQRTVVLTMKFASLEIIKKIKGEYPILLLDDVLSELDINRQKFVLKSIERIQTFITLTGYKDVKKFLQGNYKLFTVTDGNIKVEE